MEDADAELPCSGKLVFDTQKEAAAAITVAQHRYGSNLKPYQCQYCGLWHIASA